MINYISLAQQIVTSNDQSAYIQLSSAICDPTKIQHILSEINMSDYLHFTFTQLLTKSILNEQFCPINETKSDDNNQKQNNNQKTKLYSIIIPKIFHSVVCYLNYDKKEYILRSALNAISICLKDLCDNNRNLHIFSNILEATLCPSWKMNENFVNSLQGDVTILQPTQTLIDYFMKNGDKGLLIFKYSTKILIELIEYVTMVTVYKSYYDYRRNIYTFRNTFLAPILNVAVEYHKLLHSLWKIHPESLDINNALQISFTLLQKLITYPFSLTLHEFESDQEIKDNVVGTNSQIYFPGYYRNILCDGKFLDMIMEYFLFLLNKTNDFNKIRDTIYSLIRIIGRTINSSIYTFNTENQRKQFRFYCTNVIITLLFNFKFYESYYIDSLSDIFCKVLNSYTTSDLGSKRQKLFEGLIYFCENLVQNCEIKLEDGKRNPFNRAFDILVLCITESKQTSFQDSIKGKAEQILNSAFNKLCQWEVANKIMLEYGKNKRTQIECFTELFANIPPIFALNVDGNLQKLKLLEAEKFDEPQITIWLHLCSLLLPNQHSNHEQTIIILKYFNLAKTGHSIASMHYISALMENILDQMDNGTPSCNLWSWISEIQKCQFSQFMLYIIKLCKSNFQNQKNIQLIDYSLQVFKQIYVKLRNNKSQKFQLFYEEVKILITNLNTTIFENIKYFKRRVELFSVISSIWVNNENIKYIYEIYNLIGRNIRENLTAVNFLKYMHDIRGILETIDTAESFQVVVELAIEDLKWMLPTILSVENISQVFSDEYFLKTFCKMILEFVRDYCRRLTYHVQTDLPFQIHELFRPYLLQILKYSYPLCLITIWQKFAMLNPIEQLFPLHADMKNLQSKDYPSLIRQYFQNIHRVPLQMLQSLYPYIEDKVQYLIYWWEEIVRRRLHPKITLKDVVDSRIATTKKQKEELAKLIYYVGSYSDTYYNVSFFTDEGEFIKYFLQNYKDFRDK